MEAVKKQLNRANAKMTVFEMDDLSDEEDEWVKISNIPSNTAIKNLLSSCFKKLNEKVGEEESKKVVFDVFLNETESRIDSIKMANFQLDNLLRRANMKSSKKKATKRKTESSVVDDNNVEIVEPNEPSTSNQTRKKVKKAQNRNTPSLSSIGILFKSKFIA